MDFTKFNSTGNKKWNHNTDGFEYYKTSEVFEKIKEKTLTMRGIFITPDNGYGKGAVIITDKFLLNTPSAFVSVAEEILSDDDAVKEIDSTGTKFHIETFVSKKFKRNGYKIVFGEYEYTNINPNDFEPLPTDKDTPF